MIDPAVQERGELARAESAAQLRPLLANSMPKSGTHLLTAALSRVPGMDGEYERLAPAQLEAAPGEATVDIGIGLPRPASAKRVRDRLASLGPGRFALWHVPYSQPLHEMLREIDLAMLILVRDPRDVAVSHAVHLAKFAGHRLHERFRRMTDDDRITAVITGVRDERTGRVLLAPLAERYQSLLAWRRYAPSRLVRFEDLVGERGGGSAAAQRSALQAVLEFLGAPADDKVIEQVAVGMFGNSITFRRGVIGGWREALKPQHVQLIESSCASIMRDLGYEKLSAVSVPTPDLSPRTIMAQARRTSSGAPPFIVNSFPKSGTKLLCKVCSMLPGVVAMPPNPRWRAFSLIAKLRSDVPKDALVHVSQPATAAAAAEQAQAMLSRLRPGRFIEYHMAYSAELARLLERFGIPMLMMVRDPRAAVVSMADYLARATDHPMHRFFSALPADERVRRAIVGVSASEAGGPMLVDVGTRYRWRIGWLREPCVQVIRFEDLVGPAGGGDANRQHDALRAILTHLGIDARRSHRRGTAWSLRAILTHLGIGATSDLVSEMAGGSFGGTTTFHHGRIDRWREVWTDEHRQLFEKHAGDALEALGYGADAATGQQAQ